MKGKKMTYILLGGVVLVWGLIFMRIYKSLFSDSGVAEVSRSVVRKERNYEVKDTFELIAKYRDPFLGNIQASVRPVVFTGSVNTFRNKPKTTPKPKEPEVMIDWSVISYIGLIKNPGSNKNVSLMLIRGNEYLMEEGNVRDDVKLIKNLKDSVKVLYSGKEKFIKRN
ncbi:MAG: hypothetical protein J7604_18030 [Sporocytophaga sp.]|uniref:hypothetical protein n=1 Tax=Sporocytophaga sp. TaxID=2231183 RepID=UPI001B114975|nr:hypothetical protein [Sporocytophaga sp.]MBO9702113.1 hypothetical protein [Sporocytophaga sp.]